MYLRNADDQIQGPSVRGFRQSATNPGRATLKFVTYNIHYGFGRDGINSIERIAEEVVGADVIALQEVERHWPRSHMVDQVGMLAKLLPDYWIAYGPNLDLHSRAGFAGEPATARRQFGNMLLSRRPILSTTNVPLPRPATERQTMQRGALQMIIDTGTAGPLRVYSTHLDFLSVATRAAQLEAIRVLDDAAATQGGPWVGVHAVDNGWIVGDEPQASTAALILGDFNIAAGTGEYAVAAQIMSGFVDAWTLAGSGAGATKDGLRIDHGWVSTNLEQLVTRAWVDAASLGSDHHPVWFELDL